MKLVAFNGSPNLEGNTYQSIKMITSELEDKGIETEIIQVGNKNIRGCIACNECLKNQDEKCIFADDDVNMWIQKMKNADGIIIGSPVHFASIAGNMKCFLDRAFYVTSMNGMMLRQKVGAAVVAVRRAGGVPVFNQLNNYLTYSEMMVPGSNYWNINYGMTAGEIKKDKEGNQAINILTENIAYLMKIIEDSKGKIEVPKPKQKKFMNFIR